MRDDKFYAATKILAASVTGGQGYGMHVSPKLVSDAVDLAELLVAEFEKREAAADDAAAVADAAAAAKGKAEEVPTEPEPKK